MGLELKHIAGYLPYGLEMQHKYTKAKHLGEDKLRPWVSTLEPLTLQVMEKYFEWLPILRPLSDLTKEIEVNGEKFVPIEELLKTEYPSQDKTGKYSEVTISEKGFPNACFTYQANREITVFTNYIQNTPYWIVEKLYEWHFDIHGLIEKGLAIDINTLTT